jgi:uncharacterized protein
VAPVPGGPIPVLVVTAVAAAVYLRRTGVSLLGTPVPRPALVRVLILWATLSAAATAIVAVADRDHLFDLPRQQPLLWAAVAVLYPLLSVYPQELLYRGFLLHRYGGVLAGGRWASALAFGFAHLLFGNVLAVAATLAGGWLFARRYQQTGSLLLVSVEHALYGVTIFTIGLGRFFYHGAM